MYMCLIINCSLCLGSPPSRCFVECQSGGMVASASHDDQDPLTSLDHNEEVHDHVGTLNSYLFIYSID